MNASATCFTIKVVYEGGSDPVTGAVLPTESEVIEVPASTLTQARAQWRLYARIPASGRVVRTYDVDDNELFAAI